MDTSSSEQERSTPVVLRRLSVFFLVSAIAFFASIMNPLTFGFFDAESEEERLGHVEEHLGALRLLFTGIGLTEVALGVALWFWGRLVADRTEGLRRDVAFRFGQVALAAGVVSFLTRLTAWTEEAETLASDDLTVSDIVFGVVSGVGFSLSFLVFGYLMIRGAMPTWLGVVWMICGVMFWLGILPLWFFVGALAFGIRGLIRFRDGSPAGDRISATPVREATGASRPQLEVQ